MIVEMRTYTLRPGTTRQFEENFEKGLPRRLELSALGAFWHTDVGPLNQVIHLWPYESTSERDSVREAAYKLEGWPPDIRPFVETMESKILIPAPFSPALDPAEIGPLFEISTFTYSLGSIPLVVETWGEKIEKRAALSPLVGAWRTEIGALNQWIHVWAYKSADERRRVRDEATASGVWPPRLHADARIIKQESVLAMPASFSPIR